MSDCLKILLIDDNELDREIYRKHLQAFPDNVSISEFETGKAGLEYCYRQDPDCILLDFNLPDMNGLEFLSKLGNISFPIIMLTGQSDEIVAVKAMKMGVQDYLMKDSINPTYLMNAIKNAIKISQSEKERRRAQEALVRANEELENRVKERTSSLVNANKKLLEAKEIAETANRHKSVFLSKMSHELRTPMNAILGFTQLLQMDDKNPLADYQRKNMENVSSAGNHLLKLINEVLDLSMIESGNLEMVIEPVDIIPIVDNVISISKCLADGQGVSLEYEAIPDESCFVEVDPLRFKQVVLNLISNAIKYNKPNGSVIVSFEKQEGGKMRIGVEDTGHGIDEDKHGKLFKPFERFDIDTDQIEGTGIGLTISKKIVEAMAGTIGFESVAGEGSFFYIDIPLTDKMSLPTHIEKQSDSTQTFITEGDKKSILYIEDISENVELMKRIIASRYDIELLSAPNALEGIEIAETHIPDLILMDINLPGMDGLEAFKKLRAIEATRNILVIAISANAMDSDIKKALHMGFHSYITKPIDVPLFLKTMDEALKKQS